MYSLICILPEVNVGVRYSLLLVFTCFVCILKVNNSCDTVLQVCNTQCKIHVSSVDLIHCCSVLSLMLFCA